MRGVGQFGVPCVGWSVREDALFECLICAFDGSVCLWVIGRTFNVLDVICFTELAELCEFESVICEDFIG